MVNCIVNDNEVKGYNKKQEKNGKFETEKIHFFFFFSFFQERYRKKKNNKKKLSSHYRLVKAH